MKVTCALFSFSGASSVTPPPEAVTIRTVRNPTGIGGNSPCPVVLPQTYFPDPFPGQVFSVCS